jgi:hypothetical protein
VAYRGEAPSYNACPVTAKCTTSDHGRTVQRSFSIEYLKKVRGYYATEAYENAIRKRQVGVEPMFAEAKEWHGLRRLRFRGLVNANIQGLLIAAGKNLKRFLAATGLGTTKCPVREPGGPSAGAWRVVGCLRVITNQDADQGAGELNPSGPRRRHRPPEAFSTA